MGMSEEVGVRIVRMIFSAQLLPKILTFLKRLKPLSVNALIFNQQALIK